MLAKTPLIVALDFPSAEMALAFAKQLDPKTVSLKIGLQLFTAAGPKVVETLKLLGFGIFLDLKFHDIPNTVKSACIAAAEWGVDLITLHAENGSACITAVKESMLRLSNAPKLLAVTVLTSMNESALQEQHITHSLENLVANRAKLALQAGADGVVASPHEVQLLRTQFGEQPIIVTPGIRLENDAYADQARVALPEAAIAAGSNFIVVGRSITQAAFPLQVIDTILKKV